jgi:hypothetical protein
MRSAMNTPVKKIQKPFGLVLACKIAAQALHQSVAPASIVLGNLLHLQKDSIFPKELDVHYFSVQKKASSDLEKRTIMVLLDELRKHPANVAELLEKHVQNDWVEKKPVFNNNLPAKNKSKPVHTQKNKKPVAKKVAPKETITPVVVVKKSKLSV